MRAHRWIAAIIPTLGLAAGTARARPVYSTALDDKALAQARAVLAEQARTAGVEDSAVDIVLAHDVIAMTSDTGCPGVEVDVVNATDHTVWNVEVKITQKTDIEDREDVLHLPYLVTRSIVHTQVPCVASLRGGIKLGYDAKGVRSLAEALPKLREIKVDYGRAPQGGHDYTVPKAELVRRARELASVGLGDGRDAGTGAPDPDRTLLAEALGNQDDEIADELVLGIAAAGVGAEELGAAVAHDAGGPIAEAVTRALAQASPAAQAGLARVLLASSAAPAQWKTKLLALIDGRLCNAGRAEAVRLWMQAQSARALPDAELRDRVRAKCKLLASDGPLVVAALAREPGRAGEALDAIDQPLFDRVVAAWKTKQGDDANALRAYLRDSNDPARFDRAVVAVRATDLSQAIIEVARTPPGQTAPHKAAWITANLDKLADVDGAVRALTEALVKGELVADAMREVARVARAKAPAVADAVMVDYANAHVKMFAVDKLGSTIDLGAFLAFATDQLTSCDASVDALRACANAIAAYQGGALAKLTGTALRLDFTSQLPGLVGRVPDPALLAVIAGELQAAGFDTAFVVARACSAGQDASDPAPWLAALTKIDPSSDCIARLTSRQHDVIWLTLLALVGLVVPIVIGGLVLRHRYRKLQRDLPTIEADPTLAGEKLADRLGEGGLGRGLRVGVAAAARELADTAVGPSIATLDPAVLDAAVATVGRAARSGDAASVMIRRAGEAVYVVALPVRHPRPQIVERYLGAPWPEHLAAIQRAADRAVLALVILCGPEASEASLLVGFAPAPGGSPPASDPEALLDARAARERGANRFRHVMTLAATPSNEA
jgi:hypothetical protein